MKSLADRPEGASHPRSKEEQFLPGVEDAVQHFQPLVPVQRLRQCTHDLEMAQGIMDDAGEPRPAVLISFASTVSTGTSSLQGRYSHV